MNTGSDGHLCPTSSYNQGSVLLGIWCQNQGVWGRTLGVQPAFKGDSVPFWDAQNGSGGHWNRRGSKFLGSEAWPDQECDISEARKQFIRIWGTLAWSCSGLMPAQIKQLAGIEDVYFDDDRVNREHWQSRGKDPQSQAWNRSQFGRAASQALSTRALWGLRELRCCRKVVISFSSTVACSRRRRAEVVPHGHEWTGWSGRDSPCLEPGPGKAGPSVETALWPHPCSRGWAVTIWICSWVN